MDDMVRAAVHKGIKEIAITDHYDPDYPDPEFPFCPDFEKYQSSIASVRQQYAGDIKILNGIEIGIQDGRTITKCRNNAGSYPYDFIIGSFHCFNGTDLYRADYDSSHRGKDVYDFYSYVYKCLLQFLDFDVLGHINVIDRYLRFMPDYSESMEMIEEILKLIIENGKGLEINTSSYRYDLGSRTHPSSEILTLYRELGGEILTIGSDAHCTKDLGDRFHEAAENAKYHGFKYMTLYENRIPKFIPIP